MTLVKSDARVFLYLAGLVLYFSPLLLLFCFVLSWLKSSVHQPACCLEEKTQSSIKVFTFLLIYKMICFQFVTKWSPKRH